MNKEVTAKSLEKNETLDIYTLNTQHWDDGSKIVLVDYKGNNITKQKYYNYLGITFSKIQKIWLRKQFSGKATPPQTLKTEEEVVEMVANTPGAIGYVSSDKVTRDVRVIATIF